MSWELRGQHWCCLCNSKSKVAADTRGHAITSVCVVDGKLVSSNVHSRTLGPWKLAVSLAWLQGDAQWVLVCAAGKSDDRCTLQSGENLEVHTRCWRLKLKQFKEAAQAPVAANVHSAATSPHPASSEPTTYNAPTSASASNMSPHLPAAAIGFAHAPPVQSPASPPSHTAIHLPQPAPSPSRTRNRSHLEALVLEANEARLLSSRKRRKAESSLESWLERAVALQQELQAKADLEAIVAVAAQAKHVAKSKAMAGKLYAATQTAVRQAAQSRKSACRLKELRQQLHALQYEDTDITGKMHADIQSSLEAEQKTNRRLELELSQQTKAAGRAHTLARARLHSADSSSDSSDSDDGDWAPGRQLAVSSQQPALQVTSWLSSKPNQKYQPQRIIDLCRLLVQNSLPVSGVQGLLFDLASLLTGVKVSKVKSELSLPSDTTVHHGMQKLAHIVKQRDQQQLAAAKRVGSQLDEGAWKRKKNLVILASFCNRAGERVIITLDLVVVISTTAEVQLDALLAAFQAAGVGIERWFYNTSDSAASLVRMCELAQGHKLRAMHSLLQQGALVYAETARDPDGQPYLRPGAPRKRYYVPVTQHLAALAAGHDMLVDEITAPPAAAALAAPAPAAAAPMDLVPAAQQRSAVQAHATPPHPNFPFYLMQSVVDILVDYMIRTPDSMHMFKNGEICGSVYGFGGGFHPFSAAWHSSILTTLIFQVARLFSGKTATDMKSRTDAFCPQNSSFPEVPEEVNHRLMIKSKLSDVVTTHSRVLKSALQSCNIQHGGGKWVSTSMSVTVAHAHEVTCALHMPQFLVFAAALAQSHPLQCRMYQLVQLNGGFNMETNVHTLYNIITALQTAQDTPDLQLYRYAQDLYSDPRARSMLRQSELQALSNKQAVLSDDQPDKSCSAVFLHKGLWHTGKKTPRGGVHNAIAAWDEEERVDVDMWAGDESGSDSSEEDVPPTEGDYTVAKAQGMLAFEPFNRARAVAPFNRHNQQHLQQFTTEEGSAWKMRLPASPATPPNLVERSPKELAKLTMQHVSNNWMYQLRYIQHTAQAAGMLPAMNADFTLTGQHEINPFRVASYLNGQPSVECGMEYPDGLLGLSALVMDGHLLSDGHKRPCPDGCPFCASNPPLKKWTESECNQRTRRSLGFWDILQHQLPLKQALAWAVEQLDDRQTLTTRYALCPMARVFRILSRRRHEREIWKAVRIRLHPQLDEWIQKYIVNSVHSMCTERALGQAKHAMHHSTSKHTSERLALHLRPMEQRVVPTAEQDMKGEAAAKAAKQKRAAVKENGGIEDTTGMLHGLVESVKALERRMAEQERKEQRRVAAKLVLEAGGIGKAGAPRLKQLAEFMEKGSSLRFGGLVKQIREGIVELALADKTGSHLHQAISQLPPPVQE